jgi:predicted ATP-grasp superfamily ATP-dependent carboligase
MLAAAVADFRCIPDVEVRTLLDAGLRDEPTIVAADWSGVTVTWVTEDEPAAFRAVAADADYVLVIAPEFDGILEERCRWATNAGAQLLGPSPMAVALTADKFALARWLLRHGVPTPETDVSGGGRLLFPPPYVVKPRFGAGAQDTKVVSAFPTESDRPRIPAGRGDVIIQPLVSGTAASVAFLIGPRQIEALLPAEQFVRMENEFRYQGGHVPLPPGLSERAERVARRAIDAVPGLAGYVGVDVVLGDGGDFVIEINPRLTTSYVGLRALAADNLTAVLLRLVRGESVAKPRWHAGGVRWTADGQVERIA